MDQNYELIDSIEAFPRMYVSYNDRDMTTANMYIVQARKEC